MPSTRKETDSLGVVEVPTDKLWGAQTQRSLEHFRIGGETMPAPVNMAAVRWIISRRSPSRRWRNFGSCRRR